MIFHHASEGCAMATPILRPHHVCFSEANIKEISHKVSHFLLNLIKQPHLWWIQRIVEIKDPSVDMAECVKVHKAVVPNGAAGSMVKRLLGGGC